MFSRRRFLGGMLALGGSGCSSLSGSDANSTSLPSLVGGSFRAPPQQDANAYPLSAQQIHDLRYATLGVRVGEFQRSVVVLATIDGKRLNWVSADRVSFITEDGWLVGTRGLQRDLGNTRWLTAEAGPPLRAGAVPPPGVYREMDLRHANEQGLAVTSHFEAAGDETIEILGVRHAVRRIDEIADVRAWRWKVRNSYWVDAQDGRIWRSRVQYCPEMPPIELEVLKPAAV